MPHWEWYGKVGVSQYWEGHGRVKVSEGEHPHLSRVHEELELLHAVRAPRGLQVLPKRHSGDVPVSRDLVGGVLDGVGLDQFQVIGGPPH